MIVATLSYSLSHWPSSLAMWEKDFLNELEQIVKKGSDIIVYPELFLMGLAQYFEGDLNSQIKEVAVYTETTLKPMVARVLSGKDVFLCLGTGPRSVNGIITNTSWIYNNGAWGFQDKLHLTPWETSFTPGNALSLFTFKGLRIAVLICFDVEQPSLCSKLKSIGINLLLVPSATVDRNGSERVNRCASARSIELGAAVITAPLIGKSTCELVDENEGRQGFYLPAQSAIKGEQVAHSAYSADDKVVSFWEINQGDLLLLKNHDGETKPFLVSENTNIRVVI